MGYEDIFAKFEQDNVDFQAPAERLGVGQYAAVVTGFRSFTTPNDNFGVGFQMKATAPEESIDGLLDLTFYPDSSEMGERIFLQNTYTLAKHGIFKLPKTKLKDRETLIGYLEGLEPKDFKEIQLVVNVVRQKGNPKYTNTYVNGIVEPGFKPTGPKKEAKVSDEVPANVSTSIADEDDYDPFGG